jgi:hypothetical protein
MSMPEQVKTALSLASMIHAGARPGRARSGKLLMDSFLGFGVYGGLAGGRGFHGHGCCFGRWDDVTLGQGACGRALMRYQGGHDVSGLGPTGLVLSRHWRPPWLGREAACRMRQHRVSLPAASARR